MTDVNGHYTFNNLPAGSGVGYTVREVPQMRSQQTTADPPTIFLTPGETLTGIDFGIIPPA
jgi:hypothetical protein